jgi:acetyltransferase/esterase
MSTTGTLEVPGARLYHEVCGAGPVLLLIPGGNGDAGPYARLATALADRYTVVSYDRRGFSRSPCDDPPEGGLRLRDDVDDALRLLDRAGGAPAYVLGSSSGAIVGLELLAHHPQRVRLLVAHEPPLITLLPDAAARLAFFDDVYRIWRERGVDAAMEAFGAGIGMQPSAPPPGAQLPPPVREMMARMRRNQEFWLEHELRQYIRVEPDLAALRPAADRLVLGCGEESRELLPARPNGVLAERLGAPIAEFPGGHVGYATHPSEFAERLAAVLAGAPSPG